jgi:hypothetical protein
VLEALRRGFEERRGRPGVGFSPRSGWRGRAGGFEERRGRPGVGFSPRRPLASLGDVTGDR